MSSVKSLICWGGNTGKTVTLTIASPCVVTSTNHGLRDGTGLRFKSNSDTLPTGLTANVTYYAKSTAANTFNLYADAGLTTIINTSGTQSGTHILRSLLVADSANALAPYGLSDLSRWTEGATVRVYDGLSSWSTARTAESTLFTEDLCELGEAFTETVSSPVYLHTGSIKSPVVTIHSKIGDIRTPAFHAGVYGAGYKLYTTGANGLFGFNGGTYNRLLDGFSAHVQGNGAGIVIQGDNTGIRRLIVSGSGGTSNTGLRVQGSGVFVELCVFVGFWKNFDVSAYLYNYKISHCIFAKAGYSNFQAGTGATEAPANVHGIINNNICIGGASFDWSTPGTSLQLASGNLSGSANLAWMTTGGTRGTIATTDFVDYANNDFRPALITSPQVGFGFEYYGIAGADIADAYRPAYPGSLYNTAVSAGSFVTGLSYTIASVGTTDFTAVGASANTTGVTFKVTGAGTGTGTATLVTKYDTGPYQFYLGYGDWPATTTVTFVGVHSGSEVRVYDSAGSELTGVETCATDDPVLTWTLPVGDVRIVIVNTAYKIIDFSYTSASGVVALPVQQEIDKWYSNP